MARLSISFLSVLLVLAALAMSVPVKRDEAKAGALSLDSALGPLGVSLVYSFPCFRANSIHRASPR